MFGIKGLDDNIVSHGLLEMRLGGDRPMFGIGMGGTDVSLGTLTSAFRGFDTYKQSRRIANSSVDEKFHKTLRSQYSREMDDVRLQYEDILAGGTVLRENKTQIFGAVTMLNSDGQRVVSLNTSVGNDLDVGVLLAHEAFRDGVNNGAQGQRTETDAAAMGHMKVAAELLETYGAGALNSMNTMEAQAFMYAMEQRDMGMIEAYVQASYDDSSDFLKLVDGQLIRDGRSSLYIDSKYGEEFELWNMDGLTEEEALANILVGLNHTEADINDMSEITDWMTENGSNTIMTETLSEDAKKRLGIYAIVNSELQLDSRSFERIVNNSIRMSDELGYFIDFSVLEQELLENHEGQKYFTRPNTIMDPASEYTFNGTSFGETVISYGTSFGIGNIYDYQDDWSSESNEDFLLHSDNFQGVGELELSTAQMAQIHNQSLRSTGRPLVFYNNGKANFYQSYDRSINLQTNKSVGTTADAAAMISNYASGTINAINNATGIQLPTWEIGDQRYFTVVGKQLRHIENNNGSLTFVMRPDFYSYSDMYADNRVQNYAYAIDGGLTRWDRFYGGLTGWNYQRNY